jgi:hypothetical protein
MTRGVTHLRGFLRGRWRLERRILDRRLGECGFLVGSAEYRDDEGGLSYHEEGTLSFGGDCFPVSRGYRYRFPEPHIAEVRFDHGGLFHPLDFSKGAWTAAHPCGRDFYRGRFRVLAPGSWVAAWYVTGPCKDQVLKSRYRRP